MNTHEAFTSREELVAQNKRLREERGAIGEELHQREDTLATFLATQRELVAALKAMLEVREREASVHGNKSVGKDITAARAALKKAGAL